MQNTPMTYVFIANTTTYTSPWKKQLLAAIDEIYIRALKRPHDAYNSINLRDILNYLMINYGFLTPRELSKNDTNFRKQWDPNTPFEALINQIENSQEIATDGNQPYTAAQILSNAYNLVYGSGLFFEDCKQWNILPAADKTWENFKNHFLQAQHQIRLQQQTTQRHGFNTAVHHQCQLIKEATNKYTELINTINEERSALSTITSAQNSCRHLCLNKF